VLCCAVPRQDLEQLLRECDVVSLHCHLNESTRGLIGAHELALMKPTAVLINTARGHVVDKGALLEALRGGHLGGVGLDVGWDEPDDPLEELYRCVGVWGCGGVDVDDCELLQALSHDV
jgi:phosphoglycerate dehydrogenase-like enzyme